MDIVMCICYICK